MPREYFHAYHSYLKSVEPLNDAERGRLFTSLLIYSSTGAAPELRGNERFVFPTIRAQIDRDAEKYIEKCAVNRANGSLGGQANATKRGRTLPNAPRTPPKEKEKEKEKTKEKEIDTGECEGENPPKVANGSDTPSDFDVFWKAYPRKAGKGAAQKSFAKIDRALLPAILAAIEAQKNTEQWKRDGGRFIPHPATWLNQGRWEDEVTEATTGFVYDDHYEEGDSL